MNCWIKPIRSSNLLSWMLREVLGKSNYNMAEGILLFSHVQLLATPWTIAHQAHLSFTISQNLLKLMSLSRWCHPTISSSVAPFSFCPQSFPASGSFPMSWLFPSGGQSIGASSFNISPSNEYSGLISFRIGRFDLFAVQGTLNSFL